ncbi:MAG: hypothetical protein KAG61_08220 [Bacteriovoracaceae bacterium]|nr:hypothetical protein [Bacteriovoracaceae bacterium]
MKQRGLIMTLAFLILFPFFLGNSYADMRSEEVIKRYDIGYYHPERYGLRDLTFDVRIQGLTDKLNQQMIFGKLSDVHFKVYWMMRGEATEQNFKYKIMVIGMPKGFKEMKKGLKQMVATRLDYVIPQMLIESIKEYSTEYSKNRYGGIITCSDRTHKKATDKMEIFFDRKGRMTRYATYSPAGRTDTTMSMSAKAWSKNKWTVDRLTVKKHQGIQTTEMDYIFKYEKVGMYGFPKTITVITKHMLSRTTGPKGARLMQEISTDLSFSGYLVNQGIAKSVIIGK